VTFRTSLSVTSNSTLLLSASIIRQLLRFQPAASFNLFVAAIKSR